MLSMTTDYMADTGSPEPYLRRIAEAGFTHVHWCHHWNTDFAYDDCELEQIECWLHRYNLQVTDLHASAGKEKAWGSLREYERLAGVELVANRIATAERLGADVIVMHLPDLKDPGDARRSLGPGLQVARRPQADRPTATASASPSRTARCAEIDKCCRSTTRSTWASATTAATATSCPTGSIGSNASRTG